MEPGLTITKLHELYIQWMSDNYLGMDIQKLSFYRNIFTKYYNIVPLPAKTDVCDYCTYLDTEMSIHKNNNLPIVDLENELRVHKAEAKKQQKKLSDAEDQCLLEGPNNEWRTICIDLQQTLPCPRLRNQKAYYKTKL